MKRAKQWKLRLKQLLHKKTLLREAPVVTPPQPAGEPNAKKKRNPFVVLSIIVGSGWSGWAATSWPRTTKRAPTTRRCERSGTRRHARLGAGRAHRRRRESAGQKGDLWRRRRRRLHRQGQRGRGRAGRPAGAGQGGRRASDGRRRDVQGRLQRAPGGGLGIVGRRRRCGGAGASRARRPLAVAGGYAPRPTPIQARQELRAANAVPQQQLDDAQIAFEMATAAEAQAKAQLSVAESRNQAQSRVSEARGRLDQSSRIDAQNATAQAQADLAHAHVKSAEAALDTSAAAAFSTPRLSRLSTASPPS